MPNLYQIGAFILGSILLVFISRASLRTPGSHGFYRFFAWEFILGLLVLNILRWFVDPWSWHQILSWLLLILSLIPLVFGIHSLVSRGKPTRQRKGEPQLLAFEKTSTLVTTGIYSYIRHPLYSSLLLLTWGIFFKSPGWLGGGLALAATGFLFATARADEKECLRFFGREYVEYMQKSKRFLPFLF